MTCPNCKRAIPEGRIVCECFTAKAAREEIRLRCSRFLAGQGPMLVRRWSQYKNAPNSPTVEHAVTRRKREGQATYCGAKIPFGQQGLSDVIDVWNQKIACSGCQHAIEHYARKQEQVEEKAS